MFSILPLARSGRNSVLPSGNLGYDPRMIPDVPYRFTIRPLPDDEGRGYLIESQTPTSLAARPRRQQLQRPA